MSRVLCATTVIRVSPISRSANSSLQFFSTLSAISFDLLTTERRQCCSFGAVCSGSASVPLTFSVGTKSAIVRAAEKGGGNAAAAAKGFVRNLHNSSSSAVAVSAVAHSRKNGVAAGSSRKKAIDVVARAPQGCTSRAFAAPDLASRRVKCLSATLSATTQVVIRRASAAGTFVGSKHAAVVGAEGKGGAGGPTENAFLTPLPAAVAADLGVYGASLCSRGSASGSVATTTTRRLFFMVASGLILGLCRLTDIATPEWRMEKKRLFHMRRRLSRLPLDKQLQHSLRSQQITHLTEIQDAVFFQILSGKSVAAVARPATGKTLAYLLPLMQRLLNSRAFLHPTAESQCVPHLIQARLKEKQQHEEEAPESLSQGGPQMKLFLSRKGGVRGNRSSGGGRPSAIILVPTRELCKQVASTALSLLPTLSLVLADSGAPLQQQQQLLSNGAAVDFVIGTPSRCLLLLKQKFLQAQNLRSLVLDEADALLTRGYRDKIEELLQAAVGNAAFKHHQQWPAADTQPERKQLLQRKKTSQNYIGHQKKVSLQQQQKQPSADSEQLSDKEQLQHFCKQPQQHPLQSRRLQTLLFSAVMSKEFQEITNSHFFRDVAVVNLLKKKKSKRSASSTSTSSGQISGLRAELLNHDGGAAGTEAAGSLSSPVRLTLTGDFVKHFTCKVSTHVEPAATAAASSAKAATTAEARMLLILYLIASRLPRPPVDVSSSRSSGAQLQQCRTEELKKCILFTDTQKEVEHVAQHPFLEGWHVSSLHSGMTSEMRDFNIAKFRSGEASILVATDVAARGLDIPSVTLVIHLRPPEVSSYYIHRAGRTGRGGCEGESIVLYTPAEWPTITKIKEEASVDFKNLPPPTAEQHEETITARLLYDLLEVPEEAYTPHLARAKRLVQEHGANILAAALAFLHGDHCQKRLQKENSTSGRTNIRSLLTGRKGYVAVLLYDPTHSKFETQAEATRYIRRYLPENAHTEALGRVIKSTRGYVADVAVVYAEQLFAATEKCRVGGAFNRSPSAFDHVPIYHIEQLPKLLDDEVKRIRSKARYILPWSKMKTAAGRRTIAQGTHRGPFHSTRWRRSNYSSKL